MRHFDPAKWAQFARQAVEDPERAIMEDHVSSGCLGCLSLLSAARRAVDRNGGVRPRHPSKACPVRLEAQGDGLSAEWLESLSRIPARLLSS
jgi:hypothetical protein